MVDRPENILVDFDYNNIIVVDPNKIIDEDGRAKDRHIRMENMVYYANLECKVVPRTKLAVGVAANDAIQTVSVASLNFLQPGGEDYLNTKWTDEITGKDSLKGQGINQPIKNQFQNPNKSDDYYVRQTINTGGKPGATDTGLLGIKSISVTINTAFEPVISIKMIDIRGKALFESGDSSPYAVFFNLPYPLFYLTLKGYLGKAIRLPLMLTKFGASFNTGSGNFDVDLQFYTYKYNVMTEITMAGLLATPYMYKTNLRIQERSGVPNQSANVQDRTVTKGYQKIQEVYSEYKSKGIVPDDFPELTLMEMKDRLDIFIKNKMDTFAKENLQPLSDCEDYRVKLDEYKGFVFFYAGVQAWTNRFMDNENYIVLTDKKTRVYTFAKVIDTPDKRNTAETELVGIINLFNALLKRNATLGEDGKYKIGKKPEVKSAINFNINIETFRKVIQVKDIDIAETFLQRKKKEPTQAELETFQAELELQTEFQAGSFKTKGGDIKQEKKYFFFEGEGSFNEIVQRMSTDLKRIKEDIENALTEALADLLQNKNNGIGFVPNIRNVLAVFFANGEAFLRLMDDVHTKAWNERNSEVRKRAIFDPQVAGASQDNINPGDDTNTPIYPWPQFIVATNGENGQEKYEIRYPGDQSLISRTQGYLYDKWPEIEFVEEFIKGLTERDPERKEIGPTTNEVLDIKRASVNAIEFPITNQVYSNKEEVKFFYEIYERLIYLVNFSKITRANNSNSTADEISNVLAEFESANLLDSLGVNNPFIIMKLKNLGFNAQTFPLILRQISNGGIGESWQNYIRGIFNTKYIRNQITNSSFEFIKSSDFTSRATEPQLSIVDEDKLQNFINDSTAGNKVDFTDTFPFTNLDWCKNNLANGVGVSTVNQAMDTKDVLFYNKNKKVVTNFNQDTTFNQIRPITHFVFQNPSEPAVTEDNLKTVLQSRTTDYKLQLITEGNVDYSNYNGNLGLANQTSSMFNTPYFTNSIQEAIQKFRNGDPYPFTVPAYLFLNSLPLATPKEKYKTLDLGEEKTLSYIFASLKKFSGVHKVPYAWLLKLGSVWHRYKKYVESTNNFDILDNSWKNFNSLVNYDPVTSAATKTYSLTINSANVDIVLEDINTIGVGTGATTSVIINVGFYPKLINDFNVFYQGYEIIKSNQQLNGIASVSGGTILTISSVNFDQLQVGNILGGTSFLAGTTILSQINGTPGGAGQYTINLPQSVSSSNFFITNSQSVGYSDTLIQEALSSGLTMEYVAEAIINETNSARNLNTKIIPWSVSVKTPAGKFWYQIPSSGTLVNQTKLECFKKTSTNGISSVVIPVTGNTAVHNGAVRTFWTAPNYGYFDNNKLTKPSYDSYLKYVNPSSDNQENFSFSPVTPSKIEELLSIFPKDVLDGFETEFLKFSRSVYDIESDGSTNIPGGINEIPSKAAFKNFQALMRDMMKIPVITGNTGEEIVSSVQTNQFEKINSYLSDFLIYDIYFKFGNPSNYDRKLFLTFSNEEVVDPIVWEKYQIITPNSVPVNGNPTLLFSEVNYPIVWKALRTYVGFSTIQDISYKNSGSYITDFFVDFNVAFTEDNVKSFAQIIKIYATQKLNQFQINQIEPPQSPPTQPTQIVGITYLKNLFTINIEYYDGKYRTVYKNSGGTPLFESKYESIPLSLRAANNFNVTATTNVYYSAITNQVIETAYNSLSNNPNDPQYIVRQEFVEPQTYTPTPNTTQQKGKNAFQTAMSSYLSQVDNFRDKIVNNLIPKLQKSLANVNMTVEEQKPSKLTGEPQPKVELWESFKALNDKWISGNDYKTKTLFEDVLLLDRANKNIGEEVLIDIFSISDQITNINASASLYSYVTGILQLNHFVVLTIPNYINFYNVQDAVKDPKPRLEDTAEFANTLFGTFLNVDYRESTAKMVCTYAGKASEQPDVKSVDFRFRSDSFDLTRASDNPLVENQVGKKDWDKSNRVVGFNVDIGPQNQGVFKNFSVGQNSSLATSESLQILNQMANQGGNRGGATQSVSLYNLYKNRSYTCNVDMLGNALIQPTMYFNLRNVPMFSGSYYITSVSHQITDSTFETSFEGVRQPVPNLPKIDNYIQNLRANLVSKITELIKQQSTTTTAQQNTNVNSVTNNVTSNAGNGASQQVSQTTNEACKPVEQYNKFVNNTTPTEVTINYQDLIKEIKGQSNDDKLLYTIFFWSYTNSFNGKDGLRVIGNNPGYLSIDQYFGTIGNEKYFCTTKNIPYVEFSSLSNYVEFLIKRWQSRVITLQSNGEQINVDDYVKFAYINSFADSVGKGTESYNKMVGTNDFQKYKDDFNKTLQILKPATNVVTQITPPPAPPQPSILQETIVTGGLDGSFQRLTIQIKPNSGLWKIFAVNLDWTSSALCSRSGKNKSIPEYISTDQQSVLINNTDLISRIGCSGVPRNDFIGTYNFVIWVYVNPVLADGRTDQNRQQEIGKYPIQIVL